MSLIADALKAAQKEKSLRGTTPSLAMPAERVERAEPRPTPRPAPATGTAFSYFPMRAAQKRRQEGMPKPVLIGGGIGGAAILILGFWMVLKPSSAYRPAAAIAPPPAAAPMVDTVETSVASADTAVDANTGSEDPVSDASTSGDPAASVVEGPRIRRAPAVRRPPRVARVPTLTDPPAPSPVDASGTPWPAPAGSNRLQISMDRPASPQSASALFQQALEAQKRRETARALELYGRALEANPGNAEIYNNMGAIYRSIGDLEQAERAYRRAVGINPLLAVAWSNLGIVLGQRGQPREAMSALQEAMRLDPSNLDTRVNLAIQYDAAGSYTDAKLLLEGVVRTQPGLAEAHYALARVHERLGERVAAIREYTLFLSTGAGRFPQLEEPVRTRLRLLGGGR